jgi:ribosomal-protein-alanine N-acetyltransferase
MARRAVETTSPRLDGQCVSLRTPTLTDEGEFLAAVGRSRELHHPWLEAPSSSKAYRAYCERIGSADAEGFLILEEAGGLVGYATIGNIVRARFQSAYLGFAAFEPFAGRGLMRPGVRMVVNEAFGALDLHRIEANVQPENDRSAGLVRSLGFRLEGHSPRYLFIDGEWRDHDRYAITREEWGR